MKLALLLSIIAVLLGILLPMAHTPPPTESPSPLPAASADSTVRFTVQTDEGIRTATLAEYLPGVLAGEMPALFQEQALMAQTVAARTYILHRMTTTAAAHPDADVCTAPACCKAYADESSLREGWGDKYAEYAEKIHQAVTATDGIYLTYEGQPIEAVFHSSSAGATEASAAIWNPRPYLVSVESPETAEDVPNFVTESVFSAGTLKALVTKEYPRAVLDEDCSKWLTDLQYSDSGRVRSLCIGGVTLSGSQVRELLGLRSASFTVSQAGDAFTFTVSGYGHGVGMSQYGANVYAKQGRSYEEILAHYYPNTELATVSS